MTYLKMYFVQFKQSRFGILMPCYLLCQPFIFLDQVILLGLCWEEQKVKDESFLDSEDFSRNIL